MAIRPCVALLLALSIASAAWGAEENAAEQLQGTWIPTAAEIGGGKFPDELRKTIKLVIKDGRYEVTVGQQLDQGTVTLDAEATPKRLDITGTAGPNQGKTILAIYEQTGDTLRVCYDLSGKGRPEEFKAPAGTLQFLVTYQREKP